MYLVLRIPVFSPRGPPTSHFGLVFLDLFIYFFTFLVLSVFCVVQYLSVYKRQRYTYALPTNNQFQRGGTAVVVVYALYTVTLSLCIHSLFFFVFYSLFFLLFTAPGLPPNPRADHRHHLHGSRRESQRAGSLRGRESTS